MFDRQRCKTIGEETLRALRDHFGDRFQVEHKGGKFGGGSYVMKIELAETSPDGVADTREVQDFRLLAKLWGMSENHLGTSFDSRGRTFKVVGARPKNFKYPILAKRADGRVFKFKPETVLRGLAQRAPGARPGGAA
jgi:hypothetical protein